MLFDVHSPVAGKCYFAGRLDSASFSPNISYPFDSSQIPMRRSISNASTNAPDTPMNDLSDEADGFMMSQPIPEEDSYDDIAETSMVPLNGSVLAKKARREMMEDLLAEVRELHKQLKLSDVACKGMLVKMLAAVKDMYFAMYGRATETEKEVYEHIDSNTDAWLGGLYEDEVGVAQSSCTTDFDRICVAGGICPRYNSKQSNIDLTDDMQQLAKKARHAMLETMLAEVVLLRSQSKLSGCFHEEKLEEMIAEVASLYFEMYGLNAQTEAELFERVGWTRADGRKEELCDGKEDDLWEDPSDDEEEKEEMPSDVEAEAGSGDEWAEEETSGTEEAEGRSDDEKWRALERPSTLFA